MIDRIASVFNWSLILFGVGIGLGLMILGLAALIGKVYQWITKFDG